ncbi:MAG: MoaD/ThiS family protein [Candidatus Methylomirabilaceae bacterium]
MDSRHRTSRVTLQIPKSLCHYYPVKGEFITVEASPGDTVADLIKKAGLPEFEFGIVVVNGERQLPSYHPKDGETVELLPIISGG